MVVYSSIPLVLELAGQAFHVHVAVGLHIIFFRLHDLLEHSGEQSLHVLPGIERL